MTTEIIRPWPGPKPYREEDASQFFGRELEIERIQANILRQRMTLLLAGSGVGKTSLLQAGVVPRLRALRETDPEAIGPVVLVRQWGQWGRSGPPEAAFVGAIPNEISELARRDKQPGPQFRRDVEALLGVSPPDLDGIEDTYDILDAAVGYVYALTEAAGKLVLIVDQAEELLGSGLEKRDPVREKRTLDLFSNIFQRVRDCHTMLSLREEYRARLSSLSREITSLDGRQSQVEPLPRAKISEAVKAAADQVSGIRIEDRPEGGGRGSVLDIVFEWMQDKRPEGADADDAVDLLRLQALLVEIFEYAKQHNAEAGGGDSELLINDKLLRRFRADLTKEAGRELTASTLGQQALERYLNRALKRREDELRDTPPGLVRRIIVRMAPWLSSPTGFKRHNREADLIYSAIRGDLDVLRASSPPEVAREALRRMREDDELPLEYDRSNPEETVSGWGWGQDQATVGSRLAQASFQALRILLKEEILKYSEGGQGNVYELIHDGFGPALHDWSDRRRKDIGDTVASIVAQRGESFSWQPRIIKRRDLFHIRWLGCSLSKFELVDVTFRDCDLRGTIFLDCRLERCRFIDCELDGLVFKGGSWKDVQWRNCGGRSALFAGRMDWNGRIALDGCSLENTSFEGVSLGGELEAEGCTLRFAQLYSMGASARGAEFVLRDCDVTNALIEDLDEIRREGCLGEDTVLRDARPSPLGRRTEPAQEEA